MMQPSKVNIIVGRVGRGFVLAGALAIGAGAVFALASTSRPSNESAQKADRTREQAGPSEFETSVRGAQLNLSEDQKMQIRAIERESAEREKLLTEQIQAFEQTASNAPAALQRGGDPIMQSGLSRARAALQFDLESVPARTEREIRRTLTVEQRAKLDAD